MLCASAPLSGLRSPRAARISRITESPNASRTFWPMMWRVTSANPTIFGSIPDRYQAGRRRPRRVQLRSVPLRLPLQHPRRRGQRIVHAVANHHGLELCDQSPESNFMLALMVLNSAATSSLASPLEKAFSAFLSDEAATRARRSGFGSALTCSKEVGTGAAARAERAAGTLSPP